MRVRYTILLFALLISSVIKAQALVSFEKKVFIAAGDTLPYRLLYPANYNKNKHYPIVVFLHGAGQRGDNNETQLTGVPKALTDSVGRIKYPCFILAPQCAVKDVWVKFPDFPKNIATTREPTKSAGATLQLLNSLLKQLPIDKQRVYLTGYSMGGEGSFDFLTRRPHLFAAAAPICSVADTSKAKLIYKIPIWAFHGDQDDVNDVKYTRMMIEDLRKLGGKPIYTEYPGVKHNSWTNAYMEPGLFDWLFSQRKYK
jgi:predicted peptidase